MAVLRERRLRLPRKKTRIGCIDKGFHFLGINYSETQPLDGINVTQAPCGSVTPSNSAYYFTQVRGGGQVRRLLATLCLSNTVSFHMPGRYGMLVSKLNKWLTRRVATSHYWESAL